MVAGAADLGLVTGEALAEPGAHGLQRIDLGAFRMVLASAGGSSAPLACTTASPICGRQRSLQTTSWYEEQGLPVPRYKADDLGVVLQLVRAGVARAFLPEFVVEAEKLQASPEFRGSPEAIWAVWRPEAPAVVGRLAAELTAAEDA